MSTIHRFIGEKNDFNWEGVDLTVFDGSDGSKYASRRLLITEEREGAKNFVFRYFKVLPGGSSTMFDKHAHDHGVLILHGHCKVKLNDQEFHAGPMDVIYVTPNDVHHFIVEGDEPLGFLCVIPNKKLLASR
ncbi:MAG: cupin domain-containing protein [Anaerolineae bacterium]|nr:cupin domain-containing protein [Anaerolineae bacterium]